MVTNTSAITSTAHTTTSVLTSTFAASPHRINLANLNNNAEANSESSARPSKADALEGSGINSKTDKKDENLSRYLIRGAEKAGRVLQHFSIRTPHIFAAMAGTFVLWKYIWNDHTYAVKATTFVGLASTIYCFARPFFLELIPYSLLPEKNEGWRKLIGGSNTLFLAFAISRGVWGLDISEAAGTAMWLGFFVVPFSYISSQYPDIDQEFKRNP